jgi:preprotein translocase subunit SecG
MLDVLRVLLFVVFGLSSLILIVVILLQEGKGGGLAAAFGGAGADTFGVGSGGINRMTAILAGVFIVSAIILAATSPHSVVGAGDAVDETATEQPADPGTDGGAGPVTPPVDEGTDAPVDEGGGDDE